MHNPKDLEQLLHHWSNGSLNGCMSSGHVVNGIDCTQHGKRLSPMRLAHRFTLEEVDQAMIRLRAANPNQWSVLIEWYLLGWSCDRLGRALGLTLNEADRLLDSAKSELVELLINHENQAVQFRVDASHQLRQTVAV